MVLTMVSTLTSSGAFILYIYVDLMDCGILEQNDGKSLPHFAWTFADFHRLSDTNTHMYVCQFSIFSI